MVLTVAILLGVLSLAFVLYPLYRGNPAPETNSPSIKVDEAEVSMGREQTARTALREVELDYQLGNISETDYRTLREHYMRNAVNSMKVRYEWEQELDERIEEQLRKLKEQNEPV